MTRTMASAGLFVVPESGGFRQGGPAARSPQAKEWRRVDRMFGPAGHVALDRAALAPGRRVLDLGCQSGGTSLEAAHRVGPTGAVVGIDADAAAIVVAQRRAREQGLSHLRFAVSESDVLALPESAFDAVVSRFGVGVASDSEGADATLSLIRLHQTLRPGGKLSFVTFCADEPPGWQLVIQHAIASSCGASFASHLGPRLREFSCAAEGAGLRRVLAAVGFVDVTVERLECFLRAGDDLEDALEFFFETEGVGLDPFLDRQACLRLTAALRLAFEPFVRPDGVWFPAGVWLACAERAGHAGHRAA